jgi:manganese transport protein
MPEPSVQPLVPSEPLPELAPARQILAPALGHNSLEDVHRTVAIPDGRWWKRLFAFAGPAYMVSVGYMDPGNWATDIEGGARFGYRLIWVLLMSNLMAVLLQTLAARLGLVTGRDLAQACREAYGPVVRWVLFIFCEIAIAACDLAEVLGSAIAITLLFPRVPMIVAVLITGFDVLLLLAMQRMGIRKMEAFILVLVSTIGACFMLEIFLSKPQWGGVAAGFVPRRLSSAELYVAIGILGATVMPHNLYLHSALVQSRDVQRTPEGLREACRYNFIDSTVALNAAFFVNAAILIVAAAAFGSRGVQVEGVSDAHRLLDNLLGRGAAPAFAIALLCAGQSSTITGTLAGQITMEGFLHFRMRPWLRRLITRSLAIVPAVIVIGSAGAKATNDLMVLSQVVLSLQLPFAVIPLVRFTASRRKMGDFATPRAFAAIAWVVAAIIVALNAKLVGDQVHEWAEAAGRFSWMVYGASAAAGVGLTGLLAWLVFHPERRHDKLPATTAGQVFSDASTRSRSIHRIGVALEAVKADAGMLADAITLARSHNAELVLIHVVEGAGSQWYGQRTHDAEQRHDDLYLTELAHRLRIDGLPSVRTILGYGDVRKQIVAIARRENLDLLIVGGHGHKGLADVLRGQTIDGVRHGLSIPILAVRS